MQIGDRAVDPEVGVFETTNVRRNFVPRIACQSEQNKKFKGSISKKFIWKRAKRVGVVSC